MSGIFSSLEPLLKKYKVEVFLLLTAITFTIVSFSLFLYERKIPPEEPATIEAAMTVPENKMYVDLAGSVENPDVYEVSSEARLKDLLILAGGLSADADRDLFEQRFNLARRLKDQEKIYIPSKNESTENVKGTADLNNPEKININSATSTQLENLPGVGPVTVEKIIDNRPYESVDELLSRKVVGKSLFEKIREQITVN